MMPFRSGSAAREKLFLRFVDESFVFAMRGSYNSELLRQSPQGECRGALGVHQRHRLLDDLRSGEAGAATAAAAPGPG